MTAPFTVNDRRGTRRTASGLYVGNADQEFSRLRQAGYTLPSSRVQARLEARRVADTVTGGSMVDSHNRAMMSQMRRAKMASLRTGANIQLALPKLRSPLGSLEDKGIPFNVEDPKELSECRRWARAFYVTHDLVPLLVDIYARFPLVGLEFKSTDSLIEKFYTAMFLDNLDYENFLPDCLGREYYIAGEVTSLAHFNESLGIWSSEEVLNPDFVRVSKSVFIEEERVQLLVKSMVESLRDGPKGSPSEESRSEREERTFEYRQLVKYYPELIRAAQQDDGLDISPALWSRIVNKAAPWEDRGTPFLLRSYRTLMMEESLNAAQDAVADRLYSPMILATLGIENMGDGLPWIPDQDDLDALRDDMQNALAADFKLVCHHMGLNVQNVFGRESVPRFDQDYERIDLKLMQAWGIGSALIMGGTAAAGTYASSALNREVCELLMKSFQKKVIKHIKQRMEVIAEAQEHYAYEKKGGYRRPLYREVVQFNEETGEEEIVRVPELLTPDVEFRTLNLRDEAQERQFMIMLKEHGLPISDKSMAINTPIDFEQELPRTSDETVDKIVAQAEALGKAQEIVDAKKLPYPQDLATFLTNTLLLRQQLAQTQIMEAQAKMASPEGQAQAALAQAGAGGEQQEGAQPALPPGMPMPGAGAEEGGAPPQGPMAGPPPAGAPMQMGAAVTNGKPSPFTVFGPSAAAPGVLPPEMEFPDADTETETTVTPSKRNWDQPMRNWARPTESDDLKSNMPRRAKRNGDEIRPLSTLEVGPSSQGHSRRVTRAQVHAAIQRMEAQASPPSVEELVNSPKFYALTNMGAYEGQIRADFAEIMAGGAEDSRDLLEDTLERYEHLTGVRPVW
jgi:hypothetical protein